MKTVAVVIVALLLAAESASGQQASRQPMSDREQLTSKKEIETNLHKEADLKNNRIEVEVEDGVVTLKGKVDSEAERAKAEKATWVKGVTRVDDWLLVARAANKGVADSAVTREIEAQYRADKTLGHADISVSTNEGVVTLAGVIPSEAARQRAIDIAKKSPGARSVEDKLHAVGKAEPTLGTARR
jgi:hyperosmotically inducible protein